MARYGPPPLWAREPGFPTLVLLILEQQVSLASAAAAYDRLLARTGDPLTPDGAARPHRRRAARGRVQPPEDALCAGARGGGEDGSLDVDGLGALDDAGVDAALTALPGIGPWTATIYRLMVLLRPDAWPIHDIALAQAYAEVRGLAVRPRADEMDALAEGWRPYRAVAARILWHHYLSVRAERRAARGSSATRRAASADRGSPRRSAAAADR